MNDVISSFNSRVYNLEALRKQAMCTGSYCKYIVCKTRQDRINTQSCSVFYYKQVTLTNTFLVHQRNIKNFPKQVLGLRRRTMQRE